jgi:hypothetical protein
MSRRDPGPRRSSWKSLLTGTVGAEADHQIPAIRHMALNTTDRSAIVGIKGVTSHRVVTPGPSSGTTAPAPRRRVSIRSLPPTPPASPPSQPPVGWNKYKKQPTDSPRPRSRMPSRGNLTVPQRHTAYRGDPERSTRAPCPPSAPSGSTSTRFGAVRSYPLPPTPRPISLARSGETIYSPPYTASRGYEANLTLSGGRVVRILAGGRGMRLSLPTGGSRGASEGVVSGDQAKRGNESESESEIRLAEAARWSGQEARVWRTVESLIVGFKRRTPRVRHGPSTRPSIPSFPPSSRDQRLRPLLGQHLLAPRGCGDMARLTRSRL